MKILVEVLSWAWDPSYIELVVAKAKKAYCIPPPSFAAAYTFMLRSDCVANYEQ